MCVGEGCLFMLVYMFMSMCRDQPQVLFLWPLTYFLKSGLSLNLRVADKTNWPEDPVTFCPVLGIQMCATMPGFCICVLEI